jgi:copper chaperone CopZ
MAIKRAVSQLDGVSSVDGNPDTKQVVVEYDASRVGIDKIETAMAEQGYPVSK